MEEAIVEESVERCELCNSLEGTKIDTEYSYIIYDCPYLNKRICNICCHGMISNRKCFKEVEPPCMNLVQFKGVEAKWMSK